MESEVYTLRSKTTSQWHEWNPRHYLRTYFKFPKKDVLENFVFLHREIKNIAKDRKIPNLLDFGCGPTIFTGLIAAPYIQSYYCCDFLSSNLHEIRQWFIDETQSFNWSNSIQKILEIEKKTLSSVNIRSRGDLLRRLPIQITTANASQSNPVETNIKFPVIVSNFCADSATDNKETWYSYMKNIFSLLEDEGTVLLGMLRKCTMYRSGPDYFPSANIDEYDVISMLSSQYFDMNKTLLEIVHVPDCAPDGFDSIIFVRSQRLNKKEIAKLISKKSSKKHLKKTP